MTGAARRPASRLAIIGGGRWARVIGSELLQVTPSSSTICFHSPTNAGGMREWARQQEREILISDQLPDYTRPGGPEVVFVANAARDHVRAAMPAVAAGVPTFVEKPLAVSAREASTLVEQAAAAGGLLATSRVFLFNRSLAAFSREVHGQGPLRAVRFAWTDPGQETRHGEAKRYDAGLPSLKDVLPHILPILGTLSDGPPTFQDLKIERGGATVQLQLGLGGAVCSVTIARDADARRRVIEVDANRPGIRLDFAREEASTGPGPLGTMLRTFLECAASGTNDVRIAAGPALDSLSFADRAFAVYRDQQAQWLASRVGSPLDSELRYAVSELLRQTNPTATEDDLTWFWASATVSSLRAGIGESASGRD